jgi:type I restriction enzyme M protein
MQTPEEMLVMHKLLELGWSRRWIAAELGISRNTLDRYLSLGEWQPYNSTNRSGQLDEHMDWLRERFEQYHGNAEEELEANGYSFQVSRYLHSDDDVVLQRYLNSRTTVKLGDLAEIRRPVASLGRQEDDGIEVREVAPNDSDDSGQLRQGSKRIRLPESALAKGRQQLLEPGDVLLSIKGGLGKVAVVQDLEHPTVPGQAFCVVRLRPNAPLTPAALMQYLRSAVGQSLLGKAGQRPDVAFVPIGAVKSMPVVIHHPSELQRAEALEQESVALSREVEELSRKLQRLSRQSWMEDLPPDLLAIHQGEAA